jgi:hypothetical protein
MDPRQVTTMANKFQAILEGVIALFQGLYPGVPVMFIEIVISAHGGVRMRRVDSEGLLW